MRQNSWYWTAKQGKWYWAVCAGERLARAVECGRKIAAWCKAAMRRRAAALRAEKRRRRAWKPFWTSLGLCRCGKALAALAFSAIVATTVSCACANTITYNIVDYPVNEVVYASDGSVIGTDTISGTIVTDGAIGPLAASDILGGTLTFAGPGYDGSYYSVTGPLELPVISGLTASSTELILGAGPSASFLVSSGELEGSIEFGAQLQYYNMPGNTAYAGGISYVLPGPPPLAASPTSFHSTPVSTSPGSIGATSDWVIATVPEPAPLKIVIVAAICVGAACWRGHCLANSSLFTTRRSSARKGRMPGEGLQTRKLACEQLESRSLLAPMVPAGWQPLPIGGLDLLAPAVSSGATAPSGYAPNQVRGAYGLGTYAGGVLSNGISFGTNKGDGSGQTIAIVDAWDDPNALSDLNAFSTYFGLPTFDGTGRPTFSKLDENGGSSLPPTDPASTTSSSDWEIEESLDIEWAHAMAPMANIKLFEAQPVIVGYQNGKPVYDYSPLFTAVQTAANTAGVVAVSMSWSSAEFAGETTYDTIFTTPSGHIGGSPTLGGTGITGGVTFLGAAGDYGAYQTYQAGETPAITPQWPATSPNVVAVGGTSLLPSGDNYGSESSWGNGTNSYYEGGGGGGISAFESQPSYQAGWPRVIAHPGPPGL